MPTTLIIANSLQRDAYDFYTSLITGADRVIAVDGGLAPCRASDLPPTMLVGDLDSADPTDVAWATDRGVTIRRLPVRKDETDLEVAIGLALDLPSDIFAVSGVLGGRPDHELANLGALFSSGARWNVLEPSVTAWTLNAPDALVLEGSGATVSLLPWIHGATVSTTGLEFPLRREFLEPLTPRGISNAIVDSPARIEVRSGALLVVNVHLDSPPVIGYAVDVTDM